MVCGRVVDLGLTTPCRGRIARGHCAHRRGGPRWICRLAGICRSRTDPRRRRVTGSAASSASIIDRICATRRWQWLGVFVREPDGDIAAGLAGSTYGDWLFIHDLWVRADLRRRGIGQELLRLAEGRARERGCHSAWLDTDDWADGDRRRGGVKRMQAFARNCRNQSL